MLFGIRLTRGAKTSEFAFLALSWVALLVGIILANLGVIQGVFHTWLLANAPGWLAYEPLFWLAARSLLKYIETITSNNQGAILPVASVVTAMPDTSALPTTEATGGDLQSAMLIAASQIAANNGGSATVTVASK